MDWAHSVNHLKIIGFTKKENTTEALVEFNLTGHFVGKFWYSRTPPPIHNRAYKVIAIYKKYSGNWAYIESSEVN